MTSIIWKIQEMHRSAEDGLVTSVDWTVAAVSGIYNEVTVGSTSLERGEQFIEFESLTQETVIDWVKDKIGEDVVSAIEADLTNKVEKLAAPKTISGVPSSWIVIPAEPTE